MTYNESSPIEAVAATLIEKVLACRNTMDRYCVGYTVHANPALRVALDWCLEKGFLKIGTTNASARAWSRGASDEMIYMGKGGKEFFWAEQAKERAAWLEKYQGIKAKVAAEAA